MKLIVFDLDGTLLDSHAYLDMTFAETFTAEGLLPPDSEALRRVTGLSLERAMQILSGLDGDALASLTARYRTVYHSRVGTIETEPLFEGMREAVLALFARPDTLLGIATGKGLPGVERFLSLHGFTDHFVTRQTPNDNPSKPHPGMLLRAMEETGARAKDTLMIGDTSYDMEMARSAGTLALGVAWGSHPAEELRDSGAHMVIDEPSALVDAVGGLLEISHA